MTARREQRVLLFVVIGSLCYSALDPVADRLTWFMETVPVMIGVPVLLLTARRFPLTPVSYRLLALFALILIVGGHYSYAENPLFNWIKDAFELQRNHYDRLGHLLQGMVPAMVGRELLLRTSPLQRGKWLFVIVCAISLAISACYEFIEWWAALVNEQAASAFLGTQGDNWDSQWDMFLALCGSVVAQLLFAAHQDRQLARLAAKRQTVTR